MRGVRPESLALVLLITAGCAAERAPREILPFIEDDYPRAIAEAKAKKLPIFADCWTAW